MRNCARFLLVFILASVCLQSCSEGFVAEITPPAVSQGDVFIIRVTGINDPSVLPSASFSGDEILFGPSGEGAAIGVGAAGLGERPGVNKIRLNLGGIEKDLTLIVKERALKTETLTLPDEKVFLSPKDKKRVERENRLLKSIWEKNSERLWNGRFVMPLINPVSTDFGIKRVINGRHASYHKGIDIKGKAGEEVRAANGGKVVLAEELFYGGNTVVVEHGLGVFTVYMHLSRFNVKAGDMVSKGAAVGLVGSTGRSSGPHLHFSLKVGERSANPLSIFGLEL